MKAIQVKYLPVTNTRGSRWKAWAEGGNQITVPYDHALNSEGNARVAALALIAKMGWRSEITGSGVLPNLDYVFTLG